MPKLPALRGNEVIRVLGQVGFQVIRQKGSHVRLKPIARIRRLIEGEANKAAITFIVAEEGRCDHFLHSRAKFLG